VAKEKAKFKEVKSEKRAKKKRGFGGKRLGEFPGGAKPLREGIKLEGEKREGHKGVRI